MLAEWPDSISELAINESAAVLAEHATKQKFNELTHDEVKNNIASPVSKTAVKLTSFKTMQLSPVTTSAVANLNAQRGNTTHYSWDHITAKGGYMGVLPQARPGREPCHEGCRLHGLPRHAVLPHAA